MSEEIYDPRKLTAELQAAGLPVAGVSSTGRLDYARGLTAGEQKLAQQVIAAHDPAPTAEALRMQAYAEAGISAEKMIFALWKELKGGAGAEADTLQAKIAAVDRSIH